MTFLMAISGSAFLLPDCRLRVRVKPAANFYRNHFHHAPLPNRSSDLTLCCLQYLDKTLLKYWKVKSLPIWGSYRMYPVLSSQGVCTVRQWTLLRKILRYYVSAQQNCRTRRKKYSTNHSWTLLFIKSSDSSAKHTLFYSDSHRLSPWCPLAVR